MPSPQAWLQVREAELAIVLVYLSGEYVKREAEYECGYDKDWVCVLCPWVTQG